MDWKTYIVSDYHKEIKLFYAFNTTQRNCYSNYYDLQIIIIQQHNFPPTLFACSLFLSPFSPFLHPNRSNSLLPPNPSQTQNFPPSLQPPSPFFNLSLPHQPLSFFRLSAFSHPSSRFLSWPPGGFSWSSLSKPHSVICLLRFSVFPNPLLFSSPLTPIIPNRVAAWIAAGWVPPPGSGNPVLAKSLLTQTAAFHFFHLLVLHF